MPPCFAKHTLPAYQKFWMGFERPPTAKCFEVPVTEPKAEAVTEDGTDHACGSHCPWLERLKTDEVASRHDDRTSWDDGANHRHGLQQGCGKQDGESRSGVL
jgi:hypothetical protein